MSSPRNDTPPKGADAYDVTAREAWEIAKGIAEDLKEAIRNGEVTDAEDLDTRRSEAIDAALTYTRDQYVCAWGLKDERDVFDEGIIGQPSNFGEVLQAQAFLNLEDAVQAREEWDELLQVAADAREERGE